VFEVEIFLNGLDPNAVRVELYAEGIKGSDPCGNNEGVRPAPDAGTLVSIRQSYRRHAQRATYTARVVPQRPGVAVPLDPIEFLWQRRMKTPRPKLRDRTSVDSEARRRSGRLACARGNSERVAKGSLRPFSAVMPPGVQLELFDDPEDAVPHG